MINRLMIVAIFAVTLTLIVTAGAQAQGGVFEDFLFSSNQVVSNNARTTVNAGLTWMGKVVNGRRIQGRSAGGLRFDTNDDAQDLVGSYVHTHFTAITTFNAIYLKIDVNTSDSSTIHLLLRQGTDWYMSQAKTYAADTAEVILSGSLGWGLLSGSETATMNDTDGTNEVSLTVPASFSALPGGFSPDGGGLYVAATGGNQSRPRLFGIGWGEANSTSVPNVSGKTQAQAESDMIAAGFTSFVPTGTLTDWVFPTGSVRNTNPAAGIDFLTGSPVTLNVVTGIPNGWLWNGNDGDISVQANYTAVGATPPSAWPPTGNARVQGGNVTLDGAFSAKAYWFDGPSSLTLDGTDSLTLSGWLEPGAPQTSALVTVDIKDSATLDVGTNIQIGYTDGAKYPGAGHGEVTLSGSATMTASGNLRVAGNSPTGVYAENPAIGELTLIGSNVTATCGGAFLTSSPLSVLRFEADATGFSTIAQLGAGSSYWCGGTIEVDTAGYTGADNSWDLITYAGTLTEAYTSLSGIVAATSLPAGWTLDSSTAGKVTLSYVAGGGGNDVLTALPDNVWVNSPFDVKTGTFSAEFDVTVSQTPIDAAVGFSDGAASAYGNLGTIVQFHNGGFIRVRNGGSYVASTVVYVADTNYHFKLGVDVAAQTYSVWVTPDGGSETEIATDYAFRANATQLNNIAARIGLNPGTGTAVVSNLTFGSGGGSGSDGVPVAGMPVTGAIGLGLLAAACALGGSMFLRKK